MNEKFTAVNRLCMNRFLPLTAEPGVSDICLEEALKNLGLNRQVPVIHVFETIAKKRSEVRRRQLAIDWHQTRQTEIVEKYGSAWVEKGMIRYKGMQHSIPFFKKNIRTVQCFYVYRTC
jgi:hypothetical protein